jgi:hypothetical protein
MVQAGICLADDEGQDYGIRIEFPFGAGAHETAVTKGSEAQLLLCAESFVQRKMSLRISIELPKGLELIEADDAQHRDSIMEDSFTLRTEYDTWRRLIPVRICPDAREGKQEIVVHSTYEGKIRDWKVLFWVIPSSYVEKNVRLVRLSIPTDAQGRRDRKREENTLSIKDTNSRIFRSLSPGTDKSGYEFASAELENAGGYPVMLNVLYTILNKNSRTPVDWLDNHGDETGIHTPVLMTPVILRPHSCETALFKIAGGDKGLLPGEFTQKLSVGLLSSGREILTAEFPLHIKEVNMTAASMAIMAACLSLLGFAGFIALRKQIFSGFTSREYILIGLFAAVAFSLVSVPSTVAYNILHSLMGPFSFLATGILSEVLFYLLLMSLAALIPRAGTILFFVSTLFLLNGVILGNFTVASVLTYPVQALILELALLLSGLYEKDATSSEFRFLKRCGLPKMLWAALVFGIADAFLSFMTFNLTIFIYRLYYAEWYILAYVFISGFLYTFIAVPLGIRLGIRLRSVAID